MPGLFSRLKGRDGSKRKKNAMHDLSGSLPQKPKWDDAYTRPSVEAEEVHELLHFCTAELKARGLDIPFLLLPYRPTSDPSAVRTFIRRFFDDKNGLKGDWLSRELRMTAPMVISGVAKWCWSRLAGGVVGWDSYELFKIGEGDSRLARDSFKTFIPLSVESGARQRIIFDFFELIAAVAAHGKTNGFGGLQLPRMAAWWAFDHKETTEGFDGGYKAWARAADATTHLFFAYLRTLCPEEGLTGITMLPRSLEKLLKDTPYPPTSSALLTSKTNKLVMLVDTVSPTPFALLRRAGHFQYRDTDRALQEFSEYDDPVDALTEECLRVLRAVSAANESQVSSIKHSTSLRDASWSRFEDIGFAGTVEEEGTSGDLTAPPSAPLPPFGAMRTAAGSSTTDVGRPMTPSWADFLSSGFVDDSQGATNVLLPPDKVLPPIDHQIRQRSAQSHQPRLESEAALDPGELASITRLDLDNTFWWVWMSSLGPEETPARKSAFGRCAIVETKIQDGRWIVVEEMIAGAAPNPDDGAYIAEKKGLFSWTKRGKSLSRRKSTKNDLNRANKKNAGAIGSMHSNGPDTHARIAAKAAQMRSVQEHEQQNSLANTRRGRSANDPLSEKTKSLVIPQPQIAGEATSAMKWVKKYDKGAIKDAYMADRSAGRGTPVATTPDHASATSNGVAANGSAQTESNTTAPAVPAKDEFNPPVAYFAPPTRNTDVAINEATTVQPETDIKEAEIVAKSEPEPPVAAEAKPETTPKVAGALEVGAGEPATINEEPVDFSAADASPAPPAKDDDNEETKRRPQLASNPPPEAIQKGKFRATKEKSGLRKLLGRKNRSSKLPDNVSGDLQDMLHKAGGAAEDSEGANAAQGTDVAQVSSSPAPDGIPASADIPAPDQVQASPATDLAVKQPEEQPDPVSAESAAPKDAPNFNQGPLEDQPAFAPEDDDEDDATPPPIARHPPEQRAASTSPAEDPSKPAEQPESQRPKKMRGDEPVEETLNQSAGPGVQDRWAQIRKNAAKRVTGRPADSPSPPMSGKNGNDDDDEGTEESIESRVARIKARVAELTGNMETGGGPQPPPSERS